MEQTGIKENVIKENVIKEIRSLAQKYDITEVILFGSCARGDYGRASDLDLAVRGGNIARFALDVDEMTSTPLKYDIINLDGIVSDELRQSIQTEGKILYERI